MTANTRGGARLGAGRPKDPNAMVTRAFVIRQDQVEWLESYENRSEVVRAAIDNWHKHLKRLGIAD